MGTHPSGASSGVASSGNAKLGVFDPAARSAGPPRSSSQNQRLKTITFVAQTAGLDERTWLDAAGRPHSDQLRVEERYQRTDSEHLLVTLTVNDPVMYTQPWMALRISLRLQSPTFDIREMECSPSENALYNRLFALPAAGLEAKP